jgi:hypothetical protein
MDTDHNPPDDRLDEYVDRFGHCPPLLYMMHLSDEEFAERVAHAIDSGEIITDEEFEAGADRYTTIC